MNGTKTSADEACAMPGSFAVFALGLEGEQWAPLVTEYLDLCDDEHSSLQEKFLHALIRKFGFQPWTLGVLVRGALSMQWLKPAKEFRSLIANAESLDALLTVKRRFSAYLLPDEDKDAKFQAIAWQSLLWAIWGKDSQKRRQQGHQDGAQGTEREIPAGICVRRTP